MLQSLLEKVSAQPDVACIVVLAWMLAAYFTYYVIRHRYDRPLIFRPMAVVCVLGGLYYSQILLGEPSTAAGTSVQTQFLDVFVIFLYVLICWRTWHTIAQIKPRLYTALRSSLIVLPCVYLVTLVFAWQFPPPQASGSIERSAELPTAYLWTRLHLIPLAAYGVILAATFFSQVTDPIVPLRKRKIQMTLWTVGGVCLALIPLNTGLRNLLQVLAGPLNTGFVSVSLVVANGLVISGGLLFTIGLLLQCAKTPRDRTLELVLRWSEARHEIEKILFRLVYKNPGVRLAESYLKGSARIIPKASNADDLEHEAPDDVGLRDDERTKSELTFRLAVMVAASDRTKVLAHSLETLQNQVVKDDSLATSMMVGLRNDDARLLRDDLLLPCLKPAIEIGTSHKNAPNYVGHPRWKQLAAVTFAHYAKHVDLLPQATARRMLHGAVDGSVSGTYEDVKALSDSA